MQKLILLDSHAIIHRAFHAIRPLTSPAGHFVHAVYGFASILFSVLEIEHPTYIAAAFDRPEKTFRHEADAAYKATRADTSPDLISQFPLVHAVVDALAIPTLEAPGYEADDMLGTVVALLPTLPPDLHIIIVSGDRDLLQLVSPHVSVHDLTKGYRESVSFTPDVVQTRYGFPPLRLPEYKGLAGDTSDNLPGVRGIGDKTAKDLVARYGTLEDLYAHLDELTPTLRDKLLAGRTEAFRCRDMATIHCSAPLQFDLASCSVRDCDANIAEALFLELGFRSLLPRLRRLFSTPAAVISSDRGVQQSLF